MNTNAAAPLPFLRSASLPGAATAAGQSSVSAPVAGAPRGDSASDFSRLLVRSRTAADVAQRAAANAGPGAQPRRPESPTPRADVASQRPADRRATDKEAEAAVAPGDDAGAAASVSLAPATERSASLRSKTPMSTDKAMSDPAMSEPAAAAGVPDPNAAVPAEPPQALTAADLALLAAWGAIPMPPTTPSAPVDTDEAGVAAADAAGDAIALMDGEAGRGPDTSEAGEATEIPAGSIAASEKAAAEPSMRTSSDPAPRAVDAVPFAGSGAAPDAALAGLAMLSAGTRPLSERPMSPGTDLATPSNGAMGAVGALAPYRSVDAASPPVSVTVPAPITDSGFHEALGLQVSLLAREGIQQAELRLNPADMGPVSVQITMNGDRARVDFGADLAQTRQIIEAGWAELAASMQEAGFTLSGGGVSQHARDPQGAPDRSAGPFAGTRASSDADEEPAAAVIVARPRAGAALDLYA